MTAELLLATLRARGVEFQALGDRLRFRPGEVVTAEEREALRRHKAEVLRLLAPDPAELARAWLAALGRWAALTAEGPAADRAVIAATYQEIIRLQDELGEPQASTMRRQWARRHWQATGSNPWSGGSEAPAP